MNEHVAHCGEFRIALFFARNKSNKKLPIYDIIFFSKPYPEAPIIKLPSEIFKSRIQIRLINKGGVIFFQYHKATITKSALNLGKKKFDRKNNHKRMWLFLFL